MYVIRIVDETISKTIGTRLPTGNDIQTDANFSFIAISWNDVAK